MKIYKALLLISSFLLFVFSASTSQGMEQFQVKYRTSPHSKVLNRFLLNEADMAARCQARTVGYLSEEPYMAPYISAVTPSTYRSYQHAELSESGGLNLTNRDGWPPINDPKNVSGWHCYANVYSVGYEIPTHQPVEFYAAECKGRDGNPDPNPFTGNSVTGDCITTIDCDDECDLSSEISPGNGELSLQQSDYAGVGGVSPLFSARHPSRVSIPRDLLFPRAFGYAWRHEYEHVLVINNPTGSATLDLSSGTAFRFRRDNQGKWSPITPGKWSLSDNLVGTDRYVAVNSGSGEIMRFSDGGRLSSVVDKKGREYSVQYTSSNKISEISNKTGRRIQFLYGADQNVSTQIGADGSITRYEYSSNIFLRKVIWPDGSERSYRYGFDDGLPSNNVYSLTDVKDEDGQHLQIKYDQISGRATTVIYPSGTQSSVTVVANNQVRIIGSDGKSYLHKYFDDNGTLKPFQTVSECLSCGEQTKTYTYGPTGLIDSISNHDGSVDTYQYDLMKREIESRRQSQLGLRVTTTQWVGDTHRMAAVAYPGRIVAFQYDTAGRMIGRATTYTNDSTGEQGFTTPMTGATEAEGYAFDNAGRLTGYVKTEGGVAVSTLNIQTNSFGDISRVTDVKTGKYVDVKRQTDDGLPLEMENSTGARAVFTRGQNGELKTENWDGDITTHEHSLSGKLTRKIYSDGSSTEYTYDDRGLFLDQQYVPAGVLNWIFGRFLSLTGIIHDAVANDSDKWYGHNEKDFRDYVHDQKFDLGMAANENFPKKDLDDMKEQWKKEGCPRGKGGKSGRGGKVRGGGRGGGGGAGPGFSKFDQAYRRMLN